MSDYENPYKGPETTIVPEKSQNTGLTEQMMRYLFEAAPWLKFIGIMGFIGFGILCLSALISIITILNGNFGPSFSNLLLYGLMAPLAFFPAYFTYNFGNKINSFRLSNSEKDLEEAFRNNKSLWKFNGIIYIISIAFAVLAIIIAIIGGVALTSNLPNFR